MLLSFCALINALKNTFAVYLPGKILKYSKTNHSSKMALFLACISVINVPHSLFVILCATICVYVKKIGKCVISFFIFPTDISILVEMNVLYCIQQQLFLSLVDSRGETFALIASYKGSACFGFSIFFYIKGMDSLINVFR